MKDVKTEPDVVCMFKTKCNTVFPEHSFTC